LQRRFDVQLAKLNTELTAKNLGLTKSSRFINVLEVGVSNKRSNLPATEQGLEIGFELPLFDTGEARLAKAQSQYFQSLHFAAEIALTAQSEVREAYANYKEAHAMALHHRDVVLPLHEAMAEEQLLRYNGMMIGVFELLAESRLQIASVNTYMILLKDFWLAQVDLDMAISGKPALSPTSELPTLASGSVAH
jgi:outer membrane protein TolC